MDEEEILKQLDNHEERIKKIEEYIGNKPKEELIKKLSIQEVLIEKSPSSDVQRTLIFGYYIEKVEGKEEFSVSEITGCFKKVKMTVPDNTTDKINQCIRKGWITPGKQPKTYTLTNFGIKAAEEGFKEWNKKKQ